MCAGMRQLHGSWCSRLADHKRHCLTPTTVRLPTCCVVTNHTSGWSAAYSMNRRSSSTREDSDCSPAAAQGGGSHSSHLSIACLL